MTLQPSSLAFWKALARGAGLVSAAVGAAVLLGWWLDIAVLKSLHPNLVTMKANTALGLVLSGVALWLKGRVAPSGVIRRGIGRRIGQRIGQVRAGSAALLGLLTLIEYSTGGELGMDQLLFQEAPGAIGDLAPGRMALGTALSLLCCGAALLLDGESRRSGRLVYALALLTAVPALTAGLTYLYGTSEFHGFGYYPRMAVHTALTFLVLAGGIICLQPERGVIRLIRSRDAGGVMARLLLPAAIGLQIVLEWLNQAGGRAGIIEPRFGVVLVDVVNIVVFAALIVWIGRAISRAEGEALKVNEAQRHSENLFRALIENASDITLVIDAGGHVDYVSPSVTRIAGYAPEELLGRDILELIHPDDLAQVKFNLAQSIVSNPEIIHLTEGRYRRKDGSWRMFETLGKNLLADPSIAGIIVNMRDITERKQTEDSLRLADRVFHSTAEGIVVTDAAGNIVAVNPAFEAITGYGKAEVLGKNPRLLQSGRQQPEFYRDLWATLLASGLWRGEVWNRRKSGETYPEWLTISAVKDAQGHPSHYVGVFSDVSSIKATQQQIEFLTYHDALTSLPNRALLRDRLGQAMRRAQREGRPLALLYLGLDHFKGVNETLGHAAGDAVLQEVARRLTGATRAGDTLARLGGDEFVLLLEDDVIAQQVSVARKLLELFSVPIVVVGHELAMTASVGIGLYPDDGADADALLQHADQAMHYAKGEGGGTYRFVDPALSAGVQERLLMEKSLRGALANNELLLHYQPQVDLYSGEIAGLEALLRWQHPDKGLLLPAEFISLAEETGQIVAIGAWVLHEACRQLKAWHVAGHAGLRVSINVSTLQFTHGALAETLAQVLRDSGLDGQAVELELTESLIMFDFDKTLAVLMRLKALGVWLAIDSFGLGHSSFSYLKHFPIDKLKIDKSFVDGIVTDLDDASIVQAMIAMGHGLHLKMVAEGVETEAQAGYLRTLHCDQMQGFFFSHALPAGEIPALLAAHRALAARPMEGGGRVLLLVDDEANVVSALKRVLRRDGYHILSAASAEEGLELLAKHPVGVLLSDQRMPGMTGIELLSRVRVMYPRVVRMILSGYTDVNSITEAINRGEIYRFLTKPWEDEALREALKEAFMHFETERDEQGKVKMIPPASP